MGIADESEYVLNSLYKLVADWGIITTHITVESYWVPNAQGAVTNSAGYVHVGAVDDM